MADNRITLERNLGRIALALLLIGCAIILRPFLSALLWAVVLCFSIWPIYIKLVNVVGKRRLLATILMSLAIVLVLLLPLLFVGATLADNVQELTTAVRNWIDAGPPAPPAWLAKVPLAGPKAVESWQSLSGDSGKLFEKLRGLIQPVSAGLLTGGLLLGRGLIELSLSIAIAILFLHNGEAAGRRLSDFVERIGAEQGRRLLELAGQTIRGVVYGILGTALAQAVVAGIGFAIAGVPGAALLAMLTFFLSVVPVGPPLIWIPASLWLFHQGSTGWGVFMLIWGVGVSSLDNFVKPWLISQGSHMPFLVIFFGVLGGAITFGFIGVFLGPTLLAVGYRVINEWASSSPLKPIDHLAG
jgi:predicted PurR-regulated permease PerM